MHIRDGSSIPIEIVHNPAASGKFLLDEARAVDDMFELLSDSAGGDPESLLTVLGLFEMMHPELTTQLADRLGRDGVDDNLAAIAAVYAEGYWVMDRIDREELLNALRAGQLRLLVEKFRDKAAGNDSQYTIGLWWYQNHTWEDFPVWDKLLSRALNIDKN